MHSVPTCLTSSQSFETSYFAPPSPLESLPPSSPFDFDLDLLPDEIVSPTNLEHCLQAPLSSSLQTDLQLSNNNNNINKTNSNSCTTLINTFSPDCQVPNSPSSFPIDSEILSPTMFSPSSEDPANKSSEHASHSNKNSGGWMNSPGHQSQQQRNVPSASPLSMSPSSPIHSPGPRHQRRLSSTDSGKTSTSTASIRSCGALNIFGGNDFSTNQSPVSLQESLNEFAQLQQKVRLEQEGLSPTGSRFQIGGPGESTFGKLSSISTQSSFAASPQVTNVLCGLTPYPHAMIASSEGGGKIASSLSLKSKLHATIKTEPELELLSNPSRKTAVYSTRPTPLLRQVLEDKSFEQKYGVKPLDFIIEPSSLECMDKSLGEHRIITVPEPESFVKQDVAGISNNPVISLAMDQVKKDILTTCEILSISPGNLLITY